MKHLRILLGFLLVVGIALSAFAFYMSWVYGQMWLSDKASEPWRMNNYISVPCWFAYAVFGVVFLWLGSLLSGATLAGGLFYRLFTKIRWKKAFATITASLILVAIGFNTLDWMNGWIYWNMGNPIPQVVLVPFLNFQIPIDAWNFYFFFIILPLATSGFVVSFALLWLAKLQKH